eukprot:6175563-Amphidinium_carterae.1
MARYRILEVFKRQSTKRDDSKKVLESLSFDCIIPFLVAFIRREIVFALFCPAHQQNDILFNSLELNSQSTRLNTAFAQAVKVDLAKELVWGRDRSVAGVSTSERF